jgi:hypothetical protein
VPELKLMRRDQVKETLVKYNGKENGELKWLKKKVKEASNLNVKSLATIKIQISKCSITKKQIKNIDPIHFDQLW